MEGAEGNQYFYEGSLESVAGLKGFPGSPASVLRVWTGTPSAPLRAKDLGAGAADCTATREKRSLPDGAWSRRTRTLSDNGERKSQRGPLARPSFKIKATIERFNYRF